MEDKEKNQDNISNLRLSAKNKTSWFVSLWVTTLFTWDVDIRRRRRHCAALIIFCVRARRERKETAQQRFKMQEPPAQII